MTATQSYHDGGLEILEPVEGKVERVLVVGAGMAGLAVANALTNAGVDCTVFEARDRIGGRTFTDDFDGTPIDLGGSWIHNPGGNPLSRLADQFGLSRASGDFRADMVHYEIGVGRVSPEEEEALRDWYHQFEIGLEQFASQLGNDAAMTDVIDQFVDSVAPEGRMRDLLRSRINGWIEADASGPVGDVSLGYLLPPVDAGYLGDDIGDFIVGGYAALLDRLARRVDIRLGSAVGRVDYGHDGVRIHLGDGSVETGSHIVVTVPLGVLKTQGIAFSPRLPVPKEEAIGAVGFGRFEKVVLRFGTPFWTEAGFPHLLPLSRADSPRIRAVFGMDEPTGTPIVTAFDSGAGAVFRDVSDQDAVKLVVELLEEATQVKAPPVLGFRRTSWEFDPWTRGAYTYLPPGTDYADIEVLAAPVGGRLLFAGEATSVARIGYADGALTSGIREAKRLLQTPQVELG